jgi:hypothetical protein
LVREAKEEYVYEFKERKTRIDECGSGIEDWKE